MVRLLVGWALLAALMPAAGPGLPPEVRPGLSEEEVRKRLGPPPRVSRQLVAHRCLERWHYPAPVGLRLTFDCPRGKPAVLTAVQRLAP